MSRQQAIIIGLALAIVACWALGAIVWVVTAILSGRA